MGGLCYETEMSQYKVQDIFTSLKPFIIFKVVNNSEMYKSHCLLRILPSFICFLKKSLRKVDENRKNILDYKKFHTKIKFDQKCACKFTHSVICSNFVNFVYQRVQNVICRLSRITRAILLNQGEMFKVCYSVVCSRSHRLINTSGTHKLNYYFVSYLTFSKLILLFTCNKWLGYDYDPRGLTVRRHWSKRWAHSLSILSWYYQFGQLQNPDPTLKQTHTTTGFFVYVLAPCEMGSDLFINCVW